MADTGNILIKNLLSVEEIPFLCQICLQTNNVIDISQIKIEQVDLQTAFETVFHEKMFLDEPFKPNKLCKPCVQSLREFYKFLNIYKESRKKLEEFVLALKQTDDTKDVENNCYDGITEEVNVNVIKSEPETINESDVINGGKSTDEISLLSKKEKYTKCDLCGKWIYRNNFPRHKKSVHDSKKKRPPPIGVSVVCGVCDQRMWRNSLLKHFQSKHKGEQVQIKPEKTINYKRKTECDVCGKQISGQNYTRHYKMHLQTASTRIEKETFCCELCGGKTFAAKANLLEHYKSIHDSLPLKNAGYKECDICGKLIHPNNMLKHKNTQHYSRNQYFELILKGKKAQAKTEQVPRCKRKSVCDICGKQVLSPNLLKHRQLHAEHKAPLERKVCELCGKQFRNKTDFMEHFRSVHEGNPFQCDQCGKSFTRKRNLQEHVNRKHCTKAQNELRSMNSDRFIICDICGRHTPKNKRRSLILHDAFHRFGHKVMCPIPECEMTFVDRPSRLNHLNNEHEKLTCDQCHKDFFDQSRYQAHCQVHIWVNKESNIKNDSKDLTSSEKKECRICSQFFDGNQALAKHLLNIHKIYWCLMNGNCLKMYVTRGAYSFHIANHKKDANRFKCKLCPREFTTKSSYLVHEKGHNKSDGHKCPTCNYVFNKAAKLKIHMRIHTGEKPFHCQYCSKSFISMCRKKMHERYHTGEKPYQCPYCKKGFASRTEYSKHVAYEKRTNKQ